MSEKDMVISERYLRSQLEAAEAKLAAAQRTIEAQRTALEPFANCAQVWDAEDLDRVVYRARYGDSTKRDLVITVEDLFHAAAALS